jgi:hypothetical protein
VNALVDSTTRIICKYFNSMYVAEISARPQVSGQTPAAAGQCAAFKGVPAGICAGFQTLRAATVRAGQGRTAPARLTVLAGHKQARNAGCAHLDIARADSPRTPAWAGAGREHHIATGADRRSLLLNQCGRQANGHVGQDRERLLRQPTSFWPPRGRW